MTDSEHINLRVGQQTTVTVMFEGPVTTRELHRLIVYLETMLEDYPTDNERQPRQPTGGIPPCKNPSAN